MAQAAISVCESWRPMDPILIDVLVRERGFSPGKARNAAKTIRRTMAESGLSRDEVSPESLRTSASPS
jgi:hypothetical protein